MTCGDCGQTIVAEAVTFSRPTDEIEFHFHPECFELAKARLLIASRRAESESHA